MKFLGPVRFNLADQGGLAYTGVSRKFLQMAKDRMGSDKAFWIRELPDGTRIIVSSLGGVDQVWIQTNPQEIEPVIRYNSAFYLTNLPSVPLVHNEIIWYDSENAPTTPVWLQESNDYKDVDGIQQFPNPVLSPGGVTTNSGVVSLGNPLGSQGYQISSWPSVPGLSRVIPWIYNGKIHFVGNIGSTLYLYWKNFTPGMTLENGDLFNEDTAPNGWRLGSTVTLPGTGLGFVLSTKISADATKIFINRVGIKDILIRVNGTVFGGVTEYDKDETQSRGITGSKSWQYQKNATTGSSRLSEEFNGGFSPYTINTMMDYRGTIAPVRISGTFRNKDNWQYTAERDDWQPTEYLYEGSHQDARYIALTVTIGALTIPFCVYDYNITFDVAADSEELGDLVYITSNYVETRIGSGHNVTVYRQHGVILDWFPTNGGFDDFADPKHKDTITARLYDASGNILWQDVFIERELSLTHPLTIGFFFDDCQDPLPIGTPRGQESLFCYPPTDGENYPDSEVCLLEDSGSCNPVVSLAGSFDSQFIGVDGGGVQLDDFATLPNGAIAFQVSSIGVPGEDTDVRSVVINPDKSVQSISTIIPAISTIDPDNPPTIAVL